MTFEYQIIRIEEPDTAGQTVLNSLGAVGWELVNVQYIGGVFFCFLKRQINP